MSNRNAAKSSFSWTSTVLVLVVAGSMFGACGRQTADQKASGPIPPTTPATASGAEHRASGLTALSRTAPMWTPTASTSTNVNNGTDGSLTTAWRTPAAQASGQFFQVDMGEIKSFVAIRLDSATAPTEFPRNFKVQVANDNTSWATAPNIANVTGLTATPTGHPGVVTVAFAPQAARFIRVTLTNAASGIFWSVYDFNVYGTAHSRAGWVPTSPSGGTPANAMDGNTGTLWTSTTATGTTKTFELDMKSPQTFNRITLNSGASTNFPGSYSVFATNNISNWGTAIATGTGSTAFVAINFATQRAQFLRVTSTAPTWSIAEVNVEGQPTTQTAQQRVIWTAVSSPSAGTPGNAFDGSTSTRWTSGGTAMQSFTVDMKSVRTFDQIVLDAGSGTNNLPGACEVRTSNDGSTFTTVATFTGSAAVTTVNLTPARTAQWVQIRQTGATGNPWSIQEMTVSGQALSQSGWTAVTSSNSSGNIGALAFDGSASTRWTTASGQAGQSFQVDLGTTHVFNQLTLDAGSTTSGNFPRGVSVFVSTDGTTFGGTAVATATGTARIVTVNFPTQTARGIRISQTTSNTTAWTIEELSIARVDSLCDALDDANPCTVDGCNSTTGQQTHTAGNVGTPCRPATGVCDVAEACTGAVNCPTDVFAPSTTQCNDGVACTHTDRCNGAGVCAGTAITCTSDTCAVRACNGTATCTVTAQTGVACNDGNACTHTDTCNSSGACAGTTVTCTSDQCNTKTCNGTATCASTPKTGVACNDSVACTHTDTCNSSGVCAGTTIACADDQCNTKSCNGTATCASTPKTGVACNDGVACTHTDTCNSSGVCGGTATTCTSDQCNTKACNGTATCTSTPKTGVACSDNDACTQNDVCNSSGVCASGSAVTCADPGPCRTQAACVPSSGCPQPVAKPDGTACDDHSPSTAVDMCTGGVCNGSNIAPPALPVYAELIDLGGVRDGFYEDASANRGDYVGGIENAAAPRPWRKFRTNAMEDAALPSGAVGYAYGVNSDGAIVGPMSPSADWSGGTFGYFAAPNSPAQIWPSVSTWFHDVNDSNQIAGEHIVGTYRAFRLDVASNGSLTDGTLTDLPFIPTAPGAPTWALGIGPDGEVVGYSAAPPDDSVPPNLVSGWGFEHAFRHLPTDLALQDLNDLIPPQSSWQILYRATATNGDQTVGWGVSNGRLRAFRHTASTGELLDLGALDDSIPGADQGWTPTRSHFYFYEPHGINMDGDVVGHPYYGGAFYYSEARHQMYDLQDFVDPASKATLVRVWSINDAGEIVGLMGVQGDVRGHAFKMKLPASMLNPYPKVRASVAGYVDVGNGDYVAVFNYKSNETAEVQVGPGATSNALYVNGTQIASPVPTPPTRLSPGFHTGVFLPKAHIGDTVAWVLAGRAASIQITPSSSPPLAHEPIGTTGGYGVRIPDPANPGGPLMLVVIVPDTGSWEHPKDDPTALTDPEVGDPYNGTLKGTLSVSPTGAATYSLPIAIPPGIAGMAPNVSLNYNSQGGNGIAGQGWELGGLSAIYRCSKTRVQDGHARPVYMDYMDGGGDRDAVCMDGRRLFESAPGVFKSETKDFSTITMISDPSVQGSVLGNQYFRVETKTGETRWYGRNKANRVQFPRNKKGRTSVPSGSEVGFWPLDRVSDGWGNYYTVTYDPAFVDHGIRVKRIDYTGRMAVSYKGIDGPAADPFYAIEFNYYDDTPRIDSRRITFGEAYLVRNSLLKSIKTPLGTYTLMYKQDGDVTLPSRLERIRYKPVDEEALPDLVFGWEGGNYDWVSAPEFAPPANIDPPFPADHNGSPQNFPGRFFDINGDGRQDFIGDTDHVWENIGNGWVERPEWKIPFPITYGGGTRQLFADIDGDGLLDIIIDQRNVLDCDPLPCVTTESYSPAVWLNRTRTAEPNKWAFQPQLGQIPARFGYNHEGGIAFHTQHEIGDVNGDGRADIVSLNNTDEITVLLMQPDLTWLFTTDYTYGPLRLPYTLEDVNRDGLSDLVTVDQGPSFPQGVYLNAGPDQSPKWVWTPNAQIPAPAGTVGLETGDLDGDGYFDRVVFRRDGLFAPVSKVLLATGYGFTANDVGDYDSVLSHYSPPDPTMGFYDDYLYRLVDLNADGLADMVRNHHAGGPESKGQPFFNTGRRWVPVDGAPNWTAGAGPKPVPIMPNLADLDWHNGGVFVDLNGDGVTDLVQATATVRKAWINTFRPPIITGFPNGLATDTVVTYEVITTKQARQVQAGQTRATYVDNSSLATGTGYLATPMRVVAKVLRSDGIGGMGRTDYAYEDLRVSTSGHGPQGFRKVYVHEETSDPDGKTTTTTYAQASPYTGMPVLVEHYNKGNVSKTQTSYCYRSGIGVGCMEGTETNGVEFGPQTPLFIYPGKIVETSYLRPTDVAAAVTRVMTTTQHDYDTWGNPIYISVATDSRETPGGELYQHTTSNQFGAAESWEQKHGKMTRTTERTQRISPSGLYREHTTDFEYDVDVFLQPIDQDGQLTESKALSKKKEEVFRGEGYRVDTAFDYDRFGNATETLACAKAFEDCDIGQTGPDDLPFRRTFTSYEKTAFNAPAGNGLDSTLPYDSGRYPVMTENALGHREYFAYDPRFGTVKQHTDANGIHSCEEYNGFGGKTASIARCGVSNLRTTLRTHLPRPEDPGLVKTVLVVDSPGGAKSWTYADALGRTVLGKTRAFGGGFTRTATGYNHLGQVETTYKPALDGEEPATTVMGYDVLGRLTGITDTLGRIDDSANTRYSYTRTIYQGTTVLTEEDVGTEVRKKWETKNALGKVSRAKDLRSWIDYEYNSDGDLTKTTDAMGNATIYLVDDVGRQQTVVDPDMGSRVYEYNGFGELKKQTDANLHAVEMTYDKGGRMRTRKDSSGTAEWIYDQGASGAVRGKLYAVISAPDSRLNGSCPVPDVEGDGVSRTSKWFKYDAFGNVTEESECIDGDIFKTGHAYDDFGRQETTTYPATAGGERLTLRSHYTSRGFMNYVVDAADNKLYWQMTATNAAGQVVASFTRNGVETTSDWNQAGWMLGSASTARADHDKVIQRWGYRYDEGGNLRSRLRTDDVNLADSQETFGYDNLDRVTSSRVLISGLNGYDRTETYEYDDIGSITKKDGKLYTYGGCDAGPHAVCSVGGGAPFVYDDNGNMTSGSGRTVEYNVANKVRRIVNTSNGATVDFMYGADGQRVVQLVGGGTTSAGRTVYVGLNGSGEGLYQRTRRGNTTEHLHFLRGGGGTFALKVVTQNTQEGGSESIQTIERYNHLDRLGSVTAMSDEVGRVPNPASDQSNAGVLGYDPWGARRQPEGRQAGDGPSLALLVGHREFTGHETIPDVGLVNMNGRVYDQALGRFLSPDPTIQFIATVQNFNRYTYVLNNPLRLTDPTGYSIREALSNFSAALGTTALMAACGASAGGGCVAMFTIGMTMYSTGAVIMTGGGVDQVMLTIGIGAASGQLGGLAGGLIAGGFGQSAAMFVGGAVSGALGAAISTPLTGGSLGGNVLLGAISGAASASVTIGVRAIFVASQAGQQVVQTGSVGGGGNIAWPTMAEARARGIGLNVNLALTGPDGIVIGGTPPPLTGSETRSVADLDPTVRALAIAHRNAVRTAGIEGHLRPGFRTYAQQAADYAAYKAHTGPQASPPGRSLHNFRLAYHLYVFTPGTRPGTLVIAPPSDPRWARMVAMRPGGIVAGYYWKGTDQDIPHYEFRTDSVTGRTIPTNTLQSRWEHNLDPLSGSPRTHHLCNAGKCL